MAKADLHIHTRVSDGLGSIEQVLEYVERETDLDVIAVTDHEDARGGLRARDLAARRRYRFEVVPGAEITTIHGHLVALWIEDTPRSFRGVERTLETVHGMGGLAIVPHPMSWLTRSLSQRTIERICAAAEPGVQFDGIELANPSPAGNLTRARTARLNERWDLPGIGSSDAHHLRCIGSGWTEFEGQGAAALRSAVEAGKTVARSGRYPSIREVGPTNVLMQLAWGYSATPRKILGGSRNSRRHS